METDGLPMDSRTSLRLVAHRLEKTLMMLTLIASALFTWH
jgi:hypothetical protein